MKFKLPTYSLKVLGALSIMLTIVSNSYGQVNIDSVSFKSTKDTINIQAQSVLNKGDSILQISKDNLRSKKPSIKIPNDSTWFNLKNFKSKLIGSNNISLDSNAYKKFTDSVLSKVKNFKYTPSLSGSIVSESYATNYLDPFTRSEAIYTRLYGSPSIDIAGLPFNLNFFYTSEDNSFYNSNYVTLDFDINKYRQNLRAKAEDRIKEQFEAKKKSLSGLTDLSKTKQILEKRIEEEKSKVLDLKNQIERPQIDTSIIINKLRAKQENIENKAKDYISDQKDSLQNLENDSNYIAALQKKQQILDSIHRIEEQIVKYENQLKIAQEKYEKLKTINSQIRDSIGILQKQYSSEEFLQSKLKKTKIGSKISKIAERVKKFNIGLTNPMLSEYTLNGVPVKGVNLSWDLPSSNYEIAVGKTFRNEFNTFGLDQPAATFERNVIGMRSGYKFGANKNKIISLTSVSFFDDATVESPKQNFLHALDFESKVSKRMFLSLSLNHSIYKKEEVENAQIELIEGGEIAINKLQKFKDHFAIDAGVEYALSKNLQLETQYKRISPEYITLGNPFLRNNFHEIDIKAKTKLFKRKITLTSFYKRFEDNITGLSEYTNHMSGYGITARSNFKKPVNFQFQHTPYQQGNNNPDSLFRTDNQLAVTSVNVIYNKILKSNVLTSVLTYVNSTIEYNNGEQQVNNRMYLSSTNFSSKKININATFSRNTTGPSIDTLNFWGVRFGVSQKNGKRVNYAINSFYDGFDSGAVRHRSTLQARFNLLPKLETTLSGEYGQIADLYGIDQKDIFGFRLLLKYQL